MAKIDAPRFFTTRIRKGGSYHVWQPASRMITQGWKACPLVQPDGTRSPTSMAMTQAEWMNTVYDLIMAENQAGAQLALEAWSKGLSGASIGFNVSAAPFLAYDFPALTGQPMPKVQKQSFAALVAEYLKSPRFHQLRKRTALDYGNMLDDFLPLLANEPVRALRRKKLLKTYEALIKRHGKASANARMRVLSVCLSYALDLEWLDFNPLYKFRYLPTKGRIRVATEQEVEALIAAAMALPPSAKYTGPRYDAVGLIMAAALTGQRRGDLLQKMPRREFLAGRFGFENAKTESFINLEVIEELTTAGTTMLQVFEQLWGNLDTRFAELKLRNRKYWFRHMDETPLLWNLDTGLPLDGASAARLFARVRLEAAKLCPSVERLKLMDFRDYMVTSLFRAGCTDAEASAITGHSEASISLKRKHYVERHDPVIANNAMAKLKTHRTKGAA